MVGFWRIFAGAAKDRLEALALSPRAPPYAHARALGLLLTVMSQDAAGMYFLYNMGAGGFMSPSKLLLCAFDSVVVMVEGTKTLLRYGAAMANRHT